MTFSRRLQEIRTGFERPFWVANNHSGTSTLYDTSGKSTGKVVTIASSSGPSGGEPTGIVYNSTQYFKIPNIGPSLYIYAGEDGTILAWGASSWIIAARAQMESTRLCTK